MEVTVIRSKRKSVSIQVNQDLSVTMRVPKWISKREIDRILHEKERWIEKQIHKIEAGNTAYEAAGLPALTADEMRELADKALAYIPGRAAHFAPIVGVDYGRITIRSQKTRWGSCSEKGNLNFNCLLMLTPPEVIDYVVVHELCHRKELNHSKAFWSEVERVLPAYKEPRRWLKEEGNMIIGRLS